MEERSPGGSGAAAPAGAPRTPARGAAALSAAASAAAGWRAAALCTPPGTPASPDTLDTYTLWAPSLEGLL